MDKTNALNSNTPSLVAKVTIYFFSFHFQEGTFKSINYSE